MLHGIEPSHDGGHISVTGEEAEGVLRIIVEDTGVGFRNDHGSGGIGLSNLKERLHALYDWRANLDILPRASGGTRVVLELPSEEASTKLGSEGQHHTVQD